jgi:hypothetical protein
MKSAAWVRAVWAVSFVVPVAVAAAPGGASACGTAVYREIDDSAQLVAQAEQALSEGKLHKAAAKAVQAYPALKIVKPGQLPLADRALRILALASVRADGGLNVGGFKGRTAGDRATNLDWSVETLRGLNVKRPNNPSYQTDLGEAMAKVPSLHAEATKLLGELAAKDLLTTAEGYAALARLRAESGDNQARDEAVKRCEAMSKAPRLCAVPAGAVAVAAVAGQT